LAEVSFGEWLRRRRRGMGLTQQQLAARINYSTVTLKKIEAEERRPSPEVVERLAEVFNIPAEERIQFLRFARGDWQSAPASESEDTPWRDLRTVSRTNLPFQLSSFVGRSRELKEIASLIFSNRLTTLVGPGGVGKTRLSLKIGEQVLGDYAHGVWFVELAPIADPLLVPHAISIAIGLRDEPQRQVIDMLSDYLRGKKILIILDNCEHVLNACAQLTDRLLKQCANLRILATSREALGIIGEAVYQVSSLQLPNMQQFFEDFKNYESVRLFEERAQLIKTDFSLTAGNVFSIAIICTRLDGMPLAIELAAARVNIFSIEQIAAQLQENFELLTGGSRTALPRHQTLRAAIDWSYDLLSTREQILFQRLSVFVNGWTLEAAQAVASDEKIKAEEIVDLLAQLIKKSLIYTKEQQNAARYQMLEIIRQYAREKLLEAEASEIIQDRHLAYFVRLAEQAKPELYRSNQVFWLNKLNDEFGNLRWALEWALATDLKLGLQLIISSGVIWEVRGDVRELQGLLAQLLEHYDKTDSLYVRALAIYGSILGRVGNLAQAQIIGNQSLELSRAISDKHTEAFSLWRWGETLALHGDLGQGIPMVEQSLALFTSVGDKLGQAQATLWLSNNNALERSKTFILESLRLHRELGNLSGIADCLIQLALRAIWEGDFSSPVQWLEEAKIIHRQLGTWGTEKEILETYGILAYWQGDYQQACFYFEESIKLYEIIGPFLSDWAHIHMAYARLRQGNFPNAKELFKLCVQGFQKENSIGGLVYTIEGIASLEVNQERPERAVRLFAWADVMREKINDFRPPVEQASVERDLAIIQSQLDNMEFAKLIKKGKALTTEQAIEYALQFSGST